ncbi:MAG: acyl-CoA thioesterase [Bacteroidetes bacterium]|nr:acyl-CoA thioesterase [Bacteroidota bacterium]
MKIENKASMQEINKVWETQYRIRFSDCDPFNHLNNSKYIDYFINAREDHLLQFHHFDVYERIQGEGTGWVIGKNEIVYLRPALLMETVVIKSTILKIDEKNIFVEMSMWDEQKTRLKALLWTTFVYYNRKTQRPEKHDEVFMNQFQPYENLSVNTVSIDERARQLRKS